MSKRTSWPDVSRKASTEHDPLAKSNTSKYARDRLAFPMYHCQPLLNKALVIRPHGRPQIKDGVVKTHFGLTAGQWSCLSAMLREGVCLVPSMSSSNFSEEKPPPPPPLPPPRRGSFLQWPLCSAGTTPPKARAQGTGKLETTCHP